jgi:hypothetical protein
MLIRFSVSSAIKFKTLPKFVVREIHSSRMIPSSFPAVDVKWDYKTYHARPARWLDDAEDRRKKEQAKRREEKAEAERLMSRKRDPFALAASTKSSATSDSSWEAALLSQKQ